MKMKHPTRQRHPTRKRKTQPRVPGQTRRPSYTGLVRRLDVAVDREANRYNVSRSFVLAVAAARGMGIELDDRELYR